MSTYSEPLYPPALRSILPATLRRFALVYVALLIAVGALYYHTNITFLRADSGYYQMLGHLPHAQQKQSLQRFWLTSADGHYTPLAFSAEFFFTKFAGTREAIWHCRQISVMALVGAAVFCLLVSGMRGVDFPLPASGMIAAGITLVFVSNPLTTDYVAWPFHIMQLEWMLLTIVTLWLLLRIVEHPNEKKWPWLAAACGYASMHALGLGFVTACGTAAVLLLLLIGTLLRKLDKFAGQQRNLTAAFAVLIALTAAHGLCMLLLITPHDRHVDHAYRFGVAHILGLAGLYVPFALLSVFGVIVNPTTTADVIQSAWPFGTFVLLAAFVTVIIAIRNCFGVSGTVPLARATLIIFSVTGFLALLSLVSAREWHDPSDLALFGFLVGPRYLLPVGIILSGSFLWLISFAQKCTRASVVAALSLGLGLATYFAHSGYERRLSPRVTPLNCISHDRAWRLIVTSAREAKAAQLRIPNIPMGALTQEFYDFDLKLFEPLLHDELQLPRREHCEFVDWRECRTRLRANYDRAVPSLRPLMDLLRLEEKN